MTAAPCEGSRVRVFDPAGARTEFIGEVIMVDCVEGFMVERNAAHGVEWLYVTPGDGLCWEPTDVP